MKVKCRKTTYQSNRLFRQKAAYDWAVIKKYVSVPAYKFFDLTAIPKEAKEEYEKWQEQHDITIQISKGEQAEVEIVKKQLANAAVTIKKLQEQLAKYERDEAKPKGAKPKGAKPGKKDKEEA